MTQNLEDLVAGLRPMAESFSGTAASDWQDFQNAANQADAAMNADFGGGARALGTMHQIHIDADTRGAATFHS
jgi:hypothetical protein